MSNNGDPISITSNRAWPQWMKNKVETKFDDASFASPPAHEESFFYVRFPTNNRKTSLKTNLQTISDAINEEPSTSAIAGSNAMKTVEAAQAKLDYSKHTEPCRKYIAATGKESIAPPVEGVKSQTKPFGIDDGFHTAASACGTSIVRVAQQMVTGRSIARGFTVANFYEEVDQEQNRDKAAALKSGRPSTATSFVSLEDQSQMTGSPDLDSKRLQTRRGSRSLPTSPLGSPKTMRKFQNPYFTGAYTAVASTDSNRGWFLSSLLGVQREAISTTSVTSQIDEEAEEAQEAGKNKFPTSPSKGTSPNVVDGNSTAQPHQKVMRAKPSELREMNFWSPTSM